MQGLLTGDRPEGNMDDQREVNVLTRFYISRPLALSDQELRREPPDTYSASARLAG